MVKNEIRIMRGPNMWSCVHHRLLIIKYEPSALTQVDNKKRQAIMDYFLSNYRIEPYCNEFGLCLLDYTVNLAAILQGSSVYHHITEPAPGIFYGVFEYKLEEVGMESLRLVQEIIQALCEDKITITFFEALQKVNTVHLKYNEGPTTSMIIDAARKRNIPVNTGPAGFTILGHGKIRKRSVQRFPN